MAITSIFPENFLEEFWSHYLGVCDLSTLANHATICKLFRRMIEDKGFDLQKLGGSFYLTSVIWETGIYNKYKVTPELETKKKLEVHSVFYQTLIGKSYITPFMVDPMFSRLFSTCRWSLTRIEKVADLLNYSVKVENNTLVAEPKPKLLEHLQALDEMNNSFC